MPAQQALKKRGQILSECAPYEEKYVYLSAP